MTVERWHSSVGSVSVAWLTDLGPREQNSVRAAAQIHDDRAWVIAVADGLDDYPRAEEAAEAAIGGLPQRVSGRDELWQSVGEANGRVAALAPSTASEVGSAPTSALCVAAWTPTDGLAIAEAGDVVAVLQRHNTAVGPDRGELHHSRSYCGYVTRNLGRSHNSPGTDLDPTEITTVVDFRPVDASDGFTVAAFSEGAWESLVSDIEAKWRPTVAPQMLHLRLTSILDPASGDARDIAQQLMEASRANGLHDNAAVAVAHVAAQ